MGADHGYIFIDRRVVCEVLVGDFHAEARRRREETANLFDMGICFS